MYSITSNWLLLMRYEQAEDQCCASLHFCCACSIGSCGLTYIESELWNKKLRFYLFYSCYALFSSLAVNWSSDVLRVMRCSPEINEWPTLPSLVNHRLSTTQMGLTDTHQKPGTSLLRFLSGSPLQSEIGVCSPSYKRSETWIRSGWVFYVCLAT